MTTYYTKTARYYDLLNSDQVDDIPLYLEIAKETGGPILDVGCGSGRILFPFIAAGHTAQGIDENSAMISLAEHRAAALPLATQNRLTLIAGDAKQHRLPSKYAMILLSYNMLMHFLELEEQVQLLRNLSSAAQPGAQLIIDLPHPVEVFASENSDAIQHERFLTDPDSGHPIQVSSTSFFDWSHQLLDVTWIFDEIVEGSQLERIIAKQRLRYFTQSEVILLLRISGWEVNAIYGDYDRRPYADDGERLLVSASLAK